MQSRVFKYSILFLSFAISAVAGAVVYEVLRPKIFLLTNDQYIDMALDRLNASGVDITNFNEAHVDQHGRHIHVDVYHSNGEMSGGFGVTFDLDGNFVRSGIIP